MSTLVGAGDPRLAPSARLADVTALLGGEATQPEQPDQPDQDSFRRRMVAFAAAHPDALVRTCREGHFTGSAVVVDAAAQRTLLLFHRKLQRWLQPGGHVDGDANLAAVALREAGEETGIDGLLIDPEPLDLDIHRVSPPGEVPHDHLDVRYLVVAPEDAVVQGNHESEALRWVAGAELGVLELDPGTLRLIDAGLRRARRVRG